MPSNLVIFYNNTFRMSTKPSGIIYAYVSNTPTKKFNKYSENAIDYKLKRILDGI